MRPFPRDRRGWLRLGLLFAVVCAVPVQGLAEQLWPETAAVAAGDTCGGGCVLASVTRVGPVGVAPAADVRELQVNLCNSGQAGCYHDGRSPAEAAGVITRYAPDVVTLDEICDRDVTDPRAPLRHAMAQVAAERGDTAVFAYFAPALSPVTHQAYHCVNGELYGIGILGRGPVPRAPAKHYLYRGQTTRRGEERVAVCATVGTGYDVCATHLSARRGPVALSQCRQLLRPGGYAARFRAGDERPMIVGGDFNLLDPAIRACAPPTWSSTGDGDVQHVLTTAAAHITATRRITLHDTDHPGLLVDLHRTAP